MTIWRILPNENTNSAKFMTLLTAFKLKLYYLNFKYQSLINQQDSDMCEPMQFWYQKKTRNSDV